ncbi:hypothetical protein MKY29_14345 [Psychrobacillus sp. FSL K6-2365]|uniref:hypothetical protein n=1 Tax=Psychrobacillus sp. FSL K6-2365 TaxID=2921546 RepID=UPI0030F86442
MLNKTFRSKLIENARAQAHSSNSEKGSSSIEASITVRLLEEKQEQIEQDVEKLRRKHAKVLSLSH